jgi:hypothetical protein
VIRGWKPLRAPGLSYAPIVRGWLLIFCLVLLFVIPYLWVQSSSAGFRAADAIKDQYPRVETVAFINSFLGVALIVLSVRAGYRLWVASPGAVITAKRFLLILWTTDLIVSGLPFAAGLPWDIAATMLKPFFLGLANSTFWCGLWWAYLSLSKRVRTTYGLEKSLLTTDATGVGG